MKFTIQISYKLNFHSLFSPAKFILYIINIKQTRVIPDRNGNLYAADCAILKSDVAHEVCVIPDIVNHEGML